MSVLDSHCGRQVGAWAAAQGVAVDFTEYLTACGAFTCAPGLTPHCAQSPGCPDAESAPRAGAAVASFLPLPPPLPPEPDRVNWHAILGVLDRVCDGDPVRGGHAFDKLRLLEKQPGGKEQLRAMFLKSDADIRQLLPEVLDPPEAPAVVQQDEQAGPSPHTGGTTDVAPLLLPALGVQGAAGESAGAVNPAPKMASLAGSRGAASAGGSDSAASATTGERIPHRLPGPSAGVAPAVAGAVLEVGELAPQHLDFMPDCADSDDEGSSREEECNLICTATVHQRSRRPHAATHDVRV